MTQRFVVALLAGLLLAGALRAQAPAAERRLLAVSVVRESGEPVSGLTAANFRGKFRGQPVRVVSVAEDISPRRVAVVVDASQGMRSERQWPLAWSAADHLVRTLAGENEVALYVWSNDLQQVADFQRDPNRLLQALVAAHESAKAEQGSRDGPAKAVLQILEEWPGEEFADVLYLVTGSALGVSSSDRKAAEEGFARAGVRAFALWFNSLGRYDDDRTKRAYYTAHGFVTDVAEASGGWALDLSPWRTRANQLPTEVQPLYEAILNVYRLEVELPRGVDKPREWELKVVDDQGKELKHVQVLYPRLLLPLSEN